MSSPPVRIGLVGCGRVAERGWLPAIARVDAARLVAVADVDIERARSMAPDSPVYATADELVGAGGVDALVIATPPGSHLADARVATAAALPSLVEKPPARDAAQARSLAELDPAPWIGFNRRFDPAVRRLYDRLDRAGLVRLELTFHYRRASWQARMVKDEPLLDVGTHLIDLASWLTGSAARRVRARTLTPRSCRLDLELEHGVAAISCANDRLYSEGVRARDANGAPIAAASRGGLVDAVRSRIRRDTSPLLESLSAELAAFCRAVQIETLGSDPKGSDHAAGHLATARDGAAAMAVVEGARRSADSGGDWFDVSPAAPRN